MKINALIAVISIPIMMQNVGCSGGLPKGALGASAIDPGVTAQAPKINCRLIKMSDGSLLRTLDTITARDYFGTIPVENTLVKLDCSGSSTDSGNNNLNFAIDVGAGPLKMPTVSSFIIPTAGTYNYSITAVDLDNGLKTTLSFQLLSSCQQGARPALAINSGTVKISAGSQLNFFTYDATGAVSGGTGQYSYKWDFNGDSSFDRSGASLWSSSPTSASTYTVWANLRTVQLGVRDTQCNYLATAKVPFNFAIPNMDRNTRGADPTMPAYYYIQANMKPANGSSPSTAANGDFIATQYPLSDPAAPRRVQCDYKHKAGSGTPGALQVYGLNSYDDGTGNPALVHGLTFHVGNLADNNSQGEQVFDSSQPNGPVMDTAVFQTAEDPDGSTQQIYAKDPKTACTTVIKLIRKTGQVPCTNNPQILKESAQTLTLRGSFSCPNLSSGTGSIMADNGYFYCEFAPIDECVGGNGQGGGGVPPPPH